MYEKDTKLTRRKILEVGALTASGITIGSTITGSAAATSNITDGILLIEKFCVQKGVPFEFSKTLSDDADFPASCFANESELKKYQVLRMEYVDGNSCFAGVRQNKIDDIDIGGSTTYVIRSSIDCKEFLPIISKATFGPTPEAR